MCVIFDMEGIVFLWQLWIFFSIGIMASFTNTGIKLQLVYDKKSRSWV